MAPARCVHKSCVQVRDCLPGEYTTQPRRDLCVACNDSVSYTFNPANATCDACPDNANCTAALGRTMVPLPGYWHSSPLLPQVSLMSRHVGVITLHAYVVARARGKVHVWLFSSCYATHG